MDPKFAYLNKQNIGVWSRERLIAGPSKTKEQLMLKEPELTDGFQGRIFRS